MIKIAELTLKEYTFNPGKVNLILGANNTGKSTLLREISGSINNPKDIHKNLWVKQMKVEFEKVGSEFAEKFPEVQEALKFDEVDNLNDRGLQTIYGVNIWNHNVFNQLKKDSGDAFTHVIDQTVFDSEEGHYAVFLSQFKTATEFCGSRLGGPFSTQIEKITNPISNIIHYLYIQTNIFEGIQEHIKNIFDIKVGFDNLRQGDIALRIMPDTNPPPNGTVEEQSKYWEENSPFVNDQGDGIKAYLKIIFTLFNPVKDIILIDEPESFLHPPQRRNLGSFISQNVERGKQIFIATHDGEFLNGMLPSLDTKDIKILHLKDEDKDKKCNVVSFSTGERKSEQYNEVILNSFFNKSTILTEAEDDRMIYQYASKEYFNSSSQDINFIGFSGITEVLKAFKVLNDWSLSTKCILDIDYLSSQKLRSKIPLNEKDKHIMKKIKSKLDDLLSNDDYISDFKKLGIRSQTVISIREDLENAIDMLKTYAVFIIPYGSLESFFKIEKKDRRIVQKALDSIEEKKLRNLYSFIKSVLES